MDGGQQGKQSTGLNMFQCDDCTSQDKICEHKSQNKFQASPETF